MNTIADVLARLETIIEENKAANSPLGYFPVIYHLMTAGVQQRIAEGAFDDGPRMERLDVVFAQRYFDAYDAWKKGRPTTGAWATAFSAAQDSNLTVLQHILLGINAHIHLDLGIAAATIQPGPDIQLLQQDFGRINQLIESLVDPVQDRLAEIFPLFRLLDWALRTWDERFANQIIGLGRAGAWKVATTLATLEGTVQEQAILELDKGVVLLGSRIHNPGRWLAPAFRLACLAEMGSVGAKIEKLQVLTPTTLRPPADQKTV
ncbi:MAG: hypothetical protein EP344_07935 [Bacteroidetes bacterium]|nr:MAG: hypothetical protein EP344_07935 [Bacteroidota bacterium]